MNKASYTEDVPPDRFELLDKLLEAGKPLKVMLLGATDSGKTTLMTFLANKLIENGLRIAIIDSDVGQKGILPPATISVAFPTEPFESPSSLSGETHYFIGTTAPAQYIGEMAVGVKRLTDLAIKRADVVLIDTTGFVTGAGAEMKRLKAELVEPDFIVFLEKNGELSHLKRTLRYDIDAITLSVSEKIREHSREERRYVRREKWKTYFSNSRLVELDLADVSVSGTELFVGRSLDDNEKELLSEAFKWLIMAGWKGKRYVVVKADTENFPRSYSRSSLLAIDFEKLSNLVVGLLDGDGFCIGLGIIKWINFSAGSLQVLTPLGEEELEKVVEVRFGRIRVTENGEELGLLRRDEL